ncbi:Rrf2 family transcriptional regulator [Paractinoplanes rishiriensis]|uniref:Rrf2 family transcriptional regulator n=1 Tax=Paractinoplanes rishiriensis TaxID=1050105 RepID=A0A919K5D3_9ACTN|nr:Rrf2 family transcriptional regulator [Actinoplanes rishiriensis]GIE99899.1 Rrf2 family transcriptional regulator [Actinoplanes rishiriensis]
MAGNSRLTVAVHALCWLTLAKRRGRPALTSEEIAASLESNPVAVRRALGPLRDAGLITTEHGPGGGWSLRAGPADITVADVHAIVEPGPALALHAHEPRQTCPVGYGIRPVLGDIYEEAARAFTEQLSRHTIDDVLDTLLRTRPLPVTTSAATTRDRTGEDPAPASRAG